MSPARDAILGRLRASLGREDDRARASRADAWLGGAQSGPLPSLPTDPVETFCARAEAAAAVTRRVTTEAEAVAVLGEILSSGTSRAVLVAAPDPYLRALPWPAYLPVEHRHATADDRLCLSVAEAGIAETGSLVMLSGPQTASGMNFLPEHFICLLEARGILRHPEDVWARLRRASGMLPRGVHLITGPSRTADVEQTIQLGAHGPRRVTILVKG